MRRTLSFRSIGASFALALGFAVLNTAWASPSYQGPETCEKCHKAEISVWEGSKHAKSFKTAHKSDKAKAIVKAVGDKRMKKSQVCTVCHYTMIGGKAKAGPSCESCHGPSSDWFKIHNNYGEGAKRETETAEHKTERLATSTAAGMIWPTMTFDVASNCMSCHGMAQDEIAGDLIATMLDAGHPINPGFELVLYSQGSVKHRFYPPDMTKNADMSAAELARFFVAGHAAAIVSATMALEKSDHPKYVEAQNARITAAKNALDAIKGSVAEAGTLAGSPSEANARALIDAIKDMDLSAAVGGMLPAASSYK